MNAERSALFRAECDVLATGLARGVKTERELLTFLLALSRERFLLIKPVCEHHSTPFRLIAEAFFGKWQDFLAVGPRGGFKTKTLALLNAAMLLLKYGIEIAHIGAIEKQTKRGYRFMLQYLNHPYLQSRRMLRKQNLSETEVANGSRLECVTATISGVNSPHPHVLMADEVELMKEDLLDEMSMMPTSFGGHRKGSVYASTWKFAAGNITKLLKERGNDLRLHVWCALETTERCPDSKSKTEPVELELPHWTGEMKRKKVFQGCAACTLLLPCQGRLKNANGVSPIDDLVLDFQKLDVETFQAQKMSLAPVGGGRIYAEFRHEDQVGSHKHNPTWPCDLVVDFGGGTAPTVVMLFQEDPHGNGYAVWEFFSTAQTSQQDAREVASYIKARGIEIRHQIGDSAMGQSIIEWNAADEFFSIQGVKKTRTKREMIDMVKRQIRSADGQPRYFVDEDCVKHLEELRKYRRKPGSDEPIDSHDHSLDCLAYWLVHKGGNYEPKIRWLGPAYTNSNYSVSGMRGTEAGASVPVRGEEQLWRRILEDDDD